MLLYSHLHNFFFALLATKRPCNAYICSTSKLNKACDASACARVPKLGSI
jgi:hypothetical protein